MKVLGIMGSPRVKGKCSRLLDKALEGAESAGAEINNIKLIKKNIKYCMDCANCWSKNHELTIGKCPLKDDMADILEEYINSDGYIYASPVYDMYVTALMKTFLERKIALTFRNMNDHAKLPESRHPENFLKKASIIITGNCGDEFVEVMGDPCFEACEAHLMIEQIDTVDRMYAGGVESYTEAAFETRLKQAFDCGVRLVEAIRQARA